MSNKGKIKGITVSIGADTKDLDKALGDIGKQTSSMNKELREVDNLLKFDPNNTVLLAQKQELLGNQIATTATKLDALKQAQAQVEQQFANGDIGEEAYRKFQRELINTEGMLSGLQNKLSNLHAEQDKVADSTRQLSTFFEATGTSIDDFSDALGSRLTNAIKEGKATSQQLEQALNQVGQSALGAEIDINQFRDALRNANNGSNLDEIRQDLSRIADEANQAGDAVNDFGNDISSVVAGLAAGGGIAGVISEALDVSKLNTKIDISFNVPKESIENVKEATRNVTKFGIDGEEALEGVRRQWALNANASDEANAKMIEGAAVVASAYAGIDFIELVQETNEIAAALKITNDDALALVNSLLKAGFPPEQLDTIAEYGTQMEGIGFNAAQIQAIFEAGIDTKTWNIDNLNDGVKEARITMSEFGLEVDKTTAALLVGTDKSAEDFQAWGKAVASGGEQGATAMAEVSQWLKTIEDDSLRNELAIKVFGTKAEDQLGNMIAVFEGVADAQDKTVENQKELNDAIESMSADPTVLINEALGELKATLAPVLVTIAEIVGATASWIKENSTLAAVIASVVTVVGIIVATLTALAPIITAISTAAGVLGVSMGAITAPILAVVAAIAAVIAIGVLLYKNWDTIKEKATQLKDWVGKKFTEFKDSALKSVETLKTSASTKFNELTTALKNKVNGTKDSVVTAFENLRSGVVNKVTSAKDSAISIFESLKSNATSKISTLVSSIQEKFNSAKTAITKPIESAKDTVKSAIDSIKGFFTNLKLPEIKIPKIKLPHFKLTGEFSLNPPSVPKLGVEWYAKGGLMTQPTAFGMNGNNIMVGGEKGAEAILPLTANVLAGIGKGIEAQMKANTQSQVIQINPAPIILDGKVIAQATFNTINSMQYANATLTGLTKGVRI